MNCVFIMEWEWFSITNLLIEKIKFVRQSGRNLGHNFLVFVIRKHKNRMHSPSSDRSCAQTFQ